MSMNLIVRRSCFVPVGANLVFKCTVGNVGILFKTHVAPCLSLLTTVLGQALRPRMIKIITKSIFYPDSSLLQVLARVNVK